MPRNNTISPDLIFAGEKYLSTKPNAMIRSITNRALSFCSLLVVSLTVFAKPANKMDAMIAPASITDRSATLIWPKDAKAGVVTYEILLNGKPVGTTDKTNFTLTGLSPVTSYSAVIRIKNTLATGLKKLSPVIFKTTSQGKVFNIIYFGAKNDPTVSNTKAIQAAINACTAGGTVYIPKGTFISGALFLKSNMTLYIETGGTLKGSTLVEDYLPMILNRFEGWELKTYASLLNAGTLSRDGSYNVQNLRITGGGTIWGGGKILGDAMIKASGMRSRGRLICLKNAKNVSISGLTVTEPPSWTIHFIYSDHISCYNLTIVTKGIRNGDGIDPDSSTNSFIFNCTFDTGDDCIAIKSGKNPEGYFVAKPTVNVRITNCDFIRGHGISIGSEMSGGVSDVIVQDCKAGKLLHGLQIKGTKERGGYVKNVTVSGCQLLKITVFSAVNYNNDGEAAPVIPVFENFVFQDIDLSQASADEPAININGFKDPAHKLKNVSFIAIRMPENAKVSVKDADHVTFENVKSANGAKPQYTVTSSNNIQY